MLRFYAPIIIVVVATTLYHIAQKSIPAQVNPMLSLMVNYATALVVSLLIVPFYPGDSPMTSSFKYLNWGSFAVGIAIIGIELGVLLAYRVGWKISLVATIANAMAALLLVGVGLLFFREHLSGKNVLGIGLCIAGLMLIMQR
ncbi:MAG TPA: hypothetical protein VFA76_10090 [Terriglobales bacterium]|nr:hypothetical protein [Terriglobales bacterium]